VWRSPHATTRRQFDGGAGAADHDTGVVSWAIAPPFPAGEEAVHVGADLLDAQIRTYLDADVNEVYPGARLAARSGSATSVSRTAWPKAISTG
jgi:hypothetical protein